MAEPFVLVPVSEAPRPPRHPALAALITFVLVAGVLTALFKPADDDKDTAAVVRAASTKTAAETTSHFIMTMDITINGQKMPSLVTMTGEGDTATQSFKMVIQGGGVSSEVRQVGGLAYMTFDGIALPLPDGKKWVSFNPAELDPSLQSHTIQQGDFMQQLELLDGFVGEPENLGREQVDGVDVTHYGLTMNFESLLDEMQKSGEALNADQLVSALAKLKDAIDLSNLPGEVWIDDDGRAREFKFSLHIEQGGQTVDQVADMHFGQFGEPVSIEAPPADEVVPFSEIPDFFNLLPR